MSSKQKYWYLVFLHVLQWTYANKHIESFQLTKKKESIPKLGMDISSSKRDNYILHGYTFLFLNKFIRSNELQIFLLIHQQSQNIQVRYHNLITNLFNKGENNTYQRRSLENLKILILINFYVLNKLIEFRNLPLIIKPNFPTYKY